MSAEVLYRLIGLDNDLVTMPFPALKDMAKWRSPEAVIGTKLNREGQRIAAPFILRVVSYSPEVGERKGQEGLAVGLTRVQYSWIFTEELDFDSERRDVGLSGDSDNFWREMEQINAGGLVLRLRGRTAVVPVWLVANIPGWRWFHGGKPTTTAYF